MNFRLSLLKYDAFFLLCKQKCECSKHVRSQTLKKILGSSQPSTWITNIQPEPVFPVNIQETLKDKTVNNQARLKARPKDIPTEQVVICKEERPCIRQQS